MRCSPLLLLLLPICTVASACSSDLTVASGTLIACSKDADCPKQRPVCSARNRCINPLVNLPPTLSATAVPTLGRYLDQIHVDVTITDPNGAPDGDDTANVTVQYRIGDPSELHDATLIEAATALEASADGSQHRLSWDLVADAASNSQLTALLGDQDGDGIGERSIVSSSGPAYLEINATDTMGAAATPITLGPLPLGDSPPVVTLEPLASSLLGAVVLSFVVSDAEQDLVSVQIEFRDPADGRGWRKAAIVVGELDGLLPRVSPYQVSWQSNAAEDDDPSVPQGLGPKNVSNIELRIRGRDQVGDDLFYGEWATLVALTAQNQTPPQVAQASLLNVSADRVLGVLGVHYRLVDQQSDTATVAVEYSTDLGASWHPCSEYPEAESEGNEGLATASVEAGGIDHLFLWDTTADIIGKERALLRLTPADADNRGVPMELEVGQVGHDLTLSSKRFTNAWSFFGNPFILGTLTKGHFNSDGLDEVVGLASGSPPKLAVVIPQDLTQAPPSGVVEAAYNVAGAVGFAVGRLDGNGLDDVALAARSSNRVVVRLADGGAPTNPLSTATPLTLTNLTPDAVRIADVDGDHANDIIVSGYDSAAAEEELVVLMGDGNGGFTEAGERYATAFGYTLAEAVDLDGDGRAEVITTPTSEAGPTEVRHGLARSAASDPVLGTSALLPTSFSGPVKGGDFDGDGFMDLSGTRDTELVLALGLGADPQLAGFDERLVANLPVSIRQLSWADADGDGRTDLWVQTDAGYTLFRGQPALVVQGSPSYTGGLDFPCFGGALPVEASGASPPEIFTTNRSEACSYVYDGSGSPVFYFSSFWEQQAFAPPWNEYASTEVGGRANYLLDLDNDGVLDRLEVRAPDVWTQRGGGAEGFGSGRYEPSQHFSLSTNAVSATRALVADFDGDGATDILGYDASGANTTGVLLAGETTSGAPTGSFDAPMPLWTSLPVTYEPLAAGDLDGDGDVDLVTSGGVVLTDFTASEPFGNAVPLSIAPALQAAQLGYINGDDVLDMAVVWHYDGTNNAPGWYVTLIDGATREPICPADTSSCPEPKCSMILTSLETVEEMRLADLTSDGRLDLVWVAHRFSDVGVTTKLRAADTSCDPFTGGNTISLSTPQSTSILYPNSLVIDDIDRDGALDVLRGNGETPPVFMLGLESGGVGTGSLANYKTLAIGPTAAVIPKDVDRDGLLDLCGTSGGGFSLACASRERTDPLTPFSTPLLASDVIGEALEPGESARILTTPMSDTQPMRGGVSRQLLDLAHGSGLVVPDGWSAWRPLTQSWRLAGDIRVGSELDGNGQVRTAPRFRFGPRLSGVRAGLDLSNTDGAGVRGIIIRLPIPPALQGGGPASKPILVLARQTGWLRASEFPFDPLFALAAGSAYLPIVNDGQGWRTLRRKIYTWRAIGPDDDDNLTTGAGEAFVHDGDHVAVRVQALGDFQAIFEP